MKFLIFILLTFSLNSNLDAQLAEHYRFQEGEESLNLSERMAQQKTPGLVAYIDYGTGFDSLALGSSANGQNESISMNTIFPVGSLSYFPLQLEILRMDAAGELSLQDPISKYLPEIKSKNGRAIICTIEDVVLGKVKFNGPYKPSGYEKGAKRSQLSQALPSSEKLNSGNIDFPKGIKLMSNKNKNGNSECTYSIIIQLIIERVHQQPIDEIIKRNVFEPLGMNASFYSAELTEAQEANAAYGSVEGATNKGGYRRYEALGAMGLWSTAKDYSKLVRHVMEAAKGKDNRILSQKAAKSGLTMQHKFYSYIFNVAEDKSIYGGGNSKGYYTCLAANLETDVIQIFFANADLVWPLVNFAMGQTGSYIEKKKRNKTMGIYVPQNISPSFQHQIDKIQELAETENLNFELRKAEQGIPPNITALPALVLETPFGNSLYGGKLNELVSVKNFIRTTSFRSIPVKSSEKENIIYLKQGLQSIAIPLKYTGKDKLSNLEKVIDSKLMDLMNAKKGAVELFPSDRSIYLDIHPYLEENTLHLTFALFSQFNCIKPIFNNFGNPISGNFNQVDQLIDELLTNAKSKIESYLTDEDNGFALIPVTEKALMVDYVFGPNATKTPSNSSVNTTENSISGSWSRISPLAYGQPLVQFNFPSPLNRYAGEIQKISGQLENQNGIVSGKIVADLQSLTMGNADFDAKVLKSYLKVKNNPTAGFSFENIPMKFSWDAPGKQNIQGVFEFLNQKIPLHVDATIQPNATDQSLTISVNFNLEIAKAFGLPGPDGPEEAASQLEFFINFKMYA